jgi:hypothetical protein
MTERLLQYIWQYQYFNTIGLRTTQGQSLEILQVGRPNTNQGPDFLHGRIRVEETEWAGHIELHIRTTDWNLHGHSDDEHYQNIILHVVWQHDKELPLPFPCLELQPLVSKLLLKQYEALMLGRRHFIPCEQHWPGLDETVFLKWKERLLIERLLQRTDRIFVLLDKNNRHWEECFWILLARNFGMSLNADAFEKIAISLPLNLLTRHKHQLIQVEALLLGQAGLLENVFVESYPVMLQKEYRFLQKKYALKPIHEPISFLRMRPAAFPTIRLAQLASLISNSQRLFTQLLELNDFRKAMELLSVTANDYWHYHYMFDETSAFSHKNLGQQMKANLFINSIIPMIYAYGHFNQSEKITEKALRWMEEVSAESNTITRGFSGLGATIQSAFDSQAIIQLKQAYCDQKACLHCVVGNYILKNSLAGK